MKSFHFLALFLLLAAAIGTVTAQQIPIKVSAGVINGRATYLAKPEFPAAARAVGASGAVNVEVEVDENGKVVSATAVSGHPLLRSPAVDAALACRFSPIRLSGRPATVTGIIVFQFLPDGKSAPKTPSTPPVPETPLAKSVGSDFFSLGLRFGEVSKAGAPVAFDAGLIRRIIPPSWNRELELVGQIDAGLKNGAGNDGSSAGTSATPIVDAQIASLAAKFIAMIEDRLVNDSLSRWKFRMGIALKQSDLAVKSGTDEDRRQAAFAIREIAFVSPAGVEVKLVDELGAFSDLVEKGKRDEFQAEFSRLVTVIGK